jgi:hypothetical protein
MIRNEEGNMDASMSSSTSPSAGPRSKPWMVATLLLVAVACDEKPRPLEPDPSTPEVTRAFDNLPGPGATAAFAGYSLKGRWQKGDLKYFIASSAPSIAAARQRQMLSSALAAWGAVSPLNFAEVGSAGQADMVVGFGQSTHCSLYQIIGQSCPADGAFDGPNGILAHAYFPGQGVISGDAHFDLGEPWVDGSAGGISLLSVAIHEFGHSLGLDHSSDLAAIMYASYDSRDVKLSLRADDVAGIRAIYGTRGGAPPAPAPPPATPPNVSPCGSPRAGDTDGDQVPDQTEVYLLGTNPRDCDTDNDELPDFEAAHGLNPLNPDTDGDGVSDGQEVRRGSNPFIPDQGSTGSTNVGLYSGADSFGSPIGFRLFANGSAQGALRILYFGVPTDIPLVGGIDAQGRLLLLSYDYFFAYSGSVNAGRVSGQFQTAAGARGSWSAQRVAASSSSAVTPRIGTQTLVSSALYQPVRGRRIAPTFPVHQRVHVNEYQHR